MAIFSKVGKALFKSGSRKKLERTWSNSSSMSSDSCNCYDSDEEADCHGIPADVPKGCMAVYVGSAETKRFVVGTHLLKNPVFQVLLQRAADEYGYENAGALTIPCDAVLFEHFLWLLKNNDPAGTPAQR